MEIENVRLVCVAQDWQNETTFYWFELERDGEPEEYGIAKCNGVVELVDADGAPMVLEQGTFPHLVYLAIRERVDAEEGEE